MCDHVERLRVGITRYQAPFSSSTPVLDECNANEHVILQTSEFLASILAIDWDGNSADRQRKPVFPSWSRSILVQTGQIAHPIA
jgi:hypothetical protein